MPQRPHQTLPWRCSCESPSLPVLSRPMTNVPSVPQHHSYHLLRAHGEDPSHAVLVALLHACRTCGPAGRVCAHLVLDLITEVHPQAITEVVPAAGASAATVLSSAAPTTSRAPVDASRLPPAVAAAFMLGQRAAMEHGTITYGSLHWPLRHAAGVSPAMLVQRSLDSMQSKGGGTGGGKGGGCVAHAL